MTAKSKTTEADTAIVAYKAFNPDFTCRDFQFEVGKTYEATGTVKACSNGFHACENPWDTLKYYELVTLDGSLGRFAKVTLSGAVDRDGDKVCGASIVIEAELGLPGFVKAGIDWLIAATKGKSDLSDNGGDSARIGSSGDYAKIGSSGGYAQIGSSGYSAQIGSSGYSARIGSSGDSARIGSSGDYARIVASGANATVACANGTETVAVGENGAFCIPYHDGTRTRFLTGYAGEDGIEAGKAYRVVDGKLVEAGK